MASRRTREQLTIDEQDARLDADDYEKRWLQAERDAGDAERALATAVGLLREVRRDLHSDAFVARLEAFLKTQGESE